MPVYARIFNYGLACPSDLTSNRIESNRFDSFRARGWQQLLLSEPRATPWLSLYSDEQQSGPIGTRSYGSRDKPSRVIVVCPKDKAHYYARSTKVMRCPGRARADNELVAILQAASVEIASRCLPFAPRESIIFSITLIDSLSRMNPR